MSTPSAGYVRAMMRRGWDTAALAAVWNRIPGMERPDGRAWREADVWNIMADDEAMARAPRVLA